MATADELANLLRRMDITERNVSDQARTLTALTQHDSDTLARVERLEEAYQERRVVDAAEVERVKATHADITQIKADINSIKATGSKALWIFITAIILAFVAFIVKGGLA